MKTKCIDKMSAILNTLFAFVFALGAICTVMQPQAVMAQDQSQAIVDMLKKRDVEIKKLLGDKESLTDAEREKLKDLINGVIDFEKMSQNALGAQWDKVTSEQQTEFVKVFSEIVRGKSLADFEIYRLSVTYDDVKIDGDNAHVFTSTVYKEQPMKVEYTLGLQDQQWLVDDIILDGVSTTDGYARSFQTYVRKRGFDALMTNLHKRLEKLNAAD